jgi:hypothetical protein
MVESAVEASSSAAQSSFRLKMGQVKRSALSRHRSDSFAACPYSLILGNWHWSAESVVKDIWVEARDNLRKWAEKVCQIRSSCMKYGGSVLDR